MKPNPPEPRPWTWPYPQTWTQVYRDIAALLIGFLAAVYLFDWLNALFAK